ncbi:hypothetical protein AQUCO_01500298v1 [Aquilegia coerulea]|uniref:Inner membrane localized protein n=2 Tax=Aquilegia coerulea TaxID=218851 RepID=A0A2G5DT03_AQUCA|nr:hypothetical protein AQUCO_01500298v1 [Aquilegia coerulea]
MATLANPFASSTRNPHFHFSSSGSSSKLEEQWIVNASPRNLSLTPIRQKKGGISTSKRSLTVQAGYSGDAGRPSTGSIFVGGFILGGIVVGTLGCVYAPQISKALAGTDRKEIMRKLPKFIYDEEKALETRKILADKIEQLNSAIDDVSSQLRAGDPPNGMPISSDEIEAAA